MNQCSPEILVQIASNLEDETPDLLALQTTSRALNEASTTVLYEAVTIDDLTAGLLRQTLEANALLAFSVRSVRFERALAICLPRDPHTAARSILPILQLCQNLTSLIIEWGDVSDVHGTGLYAALSHLSLKSFKLRAMSGSIDLADLQPALHRSTKSLRSLSLSGLYADTQSPIVNSDFPELRSLRLETFSLSSAHFTALFSQAPRLCDVTFHLHTEGGPSTESIGELLASVGPNLVALEIDQGWFGQTGGDDQFGNMAVTACQAIIEGRRTSRLRKLHLCGQIFTKQIFSLPALATVEDLQLRWVSTIAFTDISDWLRSSLAQGRTHVLRKLDVCNEGYEQDCRSFLSFLS